MSEDTLDKRRLTAQEIHVIAGTVSHLSRPIAFVRSAEETSVPRPPPEEEPKTVNEGDGKLCEICGVRVEESRWREHILGLSHTMARPSVGATTEVLSLNETNTGYRMLRSAGWEYGQGLGVEGGGRQVPVQARVREGRRGIGVKKGGSVQKEIASPGSKRDAVAKEERDRRHRLAMMEYMKRE